jgi:hypothetical protein
VTSEELISIVSPNWVRRPPASPSQVAASQGETGVEYPLDYVSFLLWSNGGEGELFGKYLSLWPVEEVAQLNRDYAIANYIRALVVFGSDGGGEAFGFDYSSASPVIVSVPFGDLDPASKTFVGASLADFMTRG